MNTLTDNELADMAEKWIDKLIETGGKAWRLPVPANPNADVDLVLSELVNRFRKITAPASGDKPQE